MINKEVKDKIVSASLSLEKYGLNDLAWTSKDAKNLIHMIMEDRIGILGGDVYKLQSDHLESLCDNWSCEPMHQESEEAYYQRSKQESLKYIENYPVEDGVIFSMTFTEEIYSQ